ncbi:hypothetical protein IIA79_08290 [bacterium]|nr:hypothetical protein [bacterium]
MNESSNQHMKDPLDAARARLDFAAIAAAAPSARDILFKAQTIVPTAPARPWWRVATSAGVALLILAAIFAPWMGRQTVLTSLKVSFEQELARHEAQELVHQLVRELPDNMLLGAAFQAGSQSGAEGQNGRLELRVTGLGRRLPALKSWVTRLVDARQGASLMPLFDEGETIHRAIWESPLDRLLNRLAPQGRLAKWRHPGNAHARMIADSEQLFAESLASKLGGLDEDYRLKELRFVTEADYSVSEGFDFTLPAWPGRVAVDVYPYKLLTDSEQAGIRSAVEGRLRELNLVGSSLQLFDQDIAQLPITVDVFNPQGMRDRYLTERLQAFIEQPSRKDMASVAYDVKDPVEKALSRFLPLAEYNAEYQRAGAINGVWHGSYYLVKVKITGDRRRNSRGSSRYLKAIEEQQGDGEEDIEL